MGRGPTAAELARTAVARARVASLTTYPLGAGATRTVVAVEDDRGDVLVHLEPESPVVQHLAACPLATVRLAPPGCRAVVGRGCARRCDDAGGRASFRLCLEEVRVGPGERPVLPHDYERAQPDPLREEAPGVVEHLRAGHGAELAACLRAHGHAGVRWAEPLSLDRYGLEVAALRDEGVDVLRLTFPAPLEGLGDLDADLSAVLRGRGRCGGCDRWRDRT